ncbi:glutamate racemase [Buchnera aphidicola (Diuraphis noxia)]|uniref:Glutamate racemase n=1 Tax=Buchnera aphidicola subsp. Diuraphis noxia TaxID=118101 RepID=A0A1B2H932_BUCDN|nr:glutamate racemase [Buchnera aphidicola]ANZ22734.1 glutamate racemase [Buchnera aphidicola (Diuraphis noxia)]
MLIFDSGVGGLSILKNIKNTLPNIRYIYVLDNQGFPYGNKKKTFILKRSIKIINIIKKQYPIKIVLIACNTASTNTLSILKKQFNFPIIGIFPEIKFAQRITKNNIIGLIATKATINSDYIQKIIQKKPTNVTIKIIATNKLASIAEKKIRGNNTNKKELQNIFKPWINLKITPDTIILGCTHFLFLKIEIQKILYNSIYFIDSKNTVILKIKKYFYQFNIKQEIKKNIFLYSKDNKKIQELLFYLKEYNFHETTIINLN